MTTLLLDFFGTLVEYSPSRTEQGFRRSHALLGRFGVTLSYEQFLLAWARTFASFDERSEVDDREFSMVDVASAFLDAVLDREVLPAEVELLIAAYLREWNGGVHYPAGVVDLVRRLAGDHRLAVVTNTHHASLVPEHLAAMGLAGCFDTVITSVEVGWRKPHPAIYERALSTLGIGAADAVFVGDSYQPDYLGPQAAGIRALLIDPEHLAPVPDGGRLFSILDLPERLLTLR